MLYGHWEACKVGRVTPLTLNQPTALLQSEYCRELLGTTEEKKGITGTNVHI